MSPEPTPYLAPGPTPENPSKGLQAIQEEDAGKSSGREYAERESSRLKRAASEPMGGEKQDTGAHCKAVFARPEQEHLLDELRDIDVTHVRRDAIGQRLQDLGDPRPGVWPREDGLPDIEWCFVDVPEDLRGRAIASTSDEGKLAEKGWTSYVSKGIDGPMEVS